MSRPLTMRLVAQQLLPSSSASQTGLVSSTRCFSQTPSRRDKPPNTSSSGLDIYRRDSPVRQPPQRTTESPLSSSSSKDAALFGMFLNKNSVDTSALHGKPQTIFADSFEPYHLHIYAHKHNTHVTFTKPNGNTILGLSCGNVGFTKARRRGFDPAYSLAKYAFERLVYMGYGQSVNRVELSFRGFGQGREAAIKALMSPEGAFLRDKIIRVTDASRIKFAGTRSPAPKRL